MKKDSADKAQLLKQIIKETKPASGEGLTEESLGKLLNRIYAEIYPLAHTLPTLIFGERHSDPASVRVMAKLAERMAEMKHSYSFYEELPNIGTREKLLESWRKEITTGEAPYTDDDAKPMIATTPELRAARVALDDVFQKHKVPVECVDHPDCLSLYQSYESQTTRKDVINQDAHLNINNNKNLSTLEILKESQFLNDRDDHLSRYYLSGHGVIGIVGLLHLEGIQNRIAAQFAKVGRESAAGSNFCFFRIYNDDSQLLAEEKEAKLPYGAVKINLTSMTEDEAVDLIIKTAQTAQIEMQKQGYWRASPSSIADINKTLMKVIAETSPELLQQLIADAEKNLQETSEFKAPTKPLSKAEGILMLFSQPHKYREQVLIILEKNLCPQELPQAFKEFLMTEALAGRFDILLKLPKPPVDFIFQENTLLHAAVAAQNVEVTRFLLNMRAPVNVADAKGLTPLHIAAMNGNQKIVNFLLFRNAATNCIDNIGHTPADVAVHDSIRQRIREVEIERRSLQAGLFGGLSSTQTTSTSSYTHGIGR